MSSHPAVNFGQSERGLFSPEEIARLMESEYRRSLRYDYPLSLLCLEIDRLEALHDLYGVDSEQRILRAVVSMLRSSTRASDVLGMPQDAHVVVLLPHTTTQGAAVIAGRLLAGCRELEFRGDGRSLRASLSIGITTRREDPGLARMMEDGRAALAGARQAGGDRWLPYDRLPRAPEPAGTARPVDEPRRARAHVVKPAPPPPLPAIHELPGRTLAEKVRSLFEVSGLGTEFGDLERQVLGILERAPGAATRPRSRAEVLEEIRQLERHIAEQRRLLDADEEELARLVREKSADPGVASVYRTVQGLDPDARDYAHKKQLLSVLYQANVELLRQLEDEAGRSP